MMRKTAHGEERIETFALTVHAWTEWYGEARDMFSLACGEPSGQAYSRRHGPLIVLAVGVLCEELGETIQKGCLEGCGDREPRGIGLGPDILSKAVLAIEPGEVRYASERDEFYFRWRIGIGVDEV